MALTTQCPSCQTTFRVASDQLKLRAGLVRCGACHEVFDGNAHLLDNPAAPLILPADAADAAHTFVADSDDTSMASLGDTAVDAAHGITEAHIAPEPEREPEPEPESEPDPEPESELESEPESEPEPEPEPENNAEAGITAPLEFAATAEVNNDAAIAVETPADPIPDAAALAKDDPADSTALDAAPEADVEEPGFVLRARRTERYGRALRIFLWSGSALLLIALLGQGAYSFRDYLAAYFPQSQPVLQRLCGPLNCRLELLRQIDAIAIDATELQQSTVLKDTLVLTTLLRNRSSVTQAWPNLELSLNDGNEKVIVRRVFTPADYLSQPGEVAKGFTANTEQSIKLVFEVTQLKPAGYRAYLFYP